MPEDLFEPFKYAASFPSLVFVSGAVEVLVSPQDNDRVRLMVIEAEAEISIGGGVVPSPRSVAFTMHRIDN